MQGSGGDEHVNPLAVQHDAIGRGHAVSSLGDAKSSLGDAKSSLGDALELAG